ncbi:MAG: hypothetical protein KGL95_00020 [Patescibacteria group bacterium]|nr:hypothetical protein [Patescibacteria group bacterium]
MPILESYAQSTNEKTETGTQDSFNTSSIITTIVLTPIAGVIGYLLKRYFVNRDFEFQQKVEHDNWLYEQFNPLALDYYVPLAKFAFDAINSIGKAVEVLTNDDSINIAYFNTCLFLSKYTDFKNSKGANFLFKTREFEQEAITAMRAILSSLPFNDLDIISINKKMQNQKKPANQFAGHEYHVFRNWLTSENCRLSVNLVMDRLNYLQKILDTGGEEIAHPDAFDDSNRPIKIIPPMPEDDIFYIYSSNTKYVQRGDTVAIIGSGFLHDRVSYSFFIGARELRTMQKNDDIIHLQIPNDIPVGIYDVFARFNVSRFGHIDSNQTIGIPLTVSN